MKYLLLFSLIFLFIVAAVPVSAAIKIVDVNLVPSANCLSQHPCTTLEPSNTVPSISLGPSAAVPSGTAVSGQPSSSPSVVPSVNPSPSSTPCSTSQSSVFSQSTGTVQAFHYHGKRHHPMKRGFLQQFFELLLQLLQFLLQKIGIQLPAINPCSPSSSPSGTPSESPSGAPSVSGEQPTPSSTISQSPPASGSGTASASAMIVGINLNGFSGNATDMAGAVKYVRADLKAFGVTATTFGNAGMKVDDLLQGPYSTSGISGLGSATTWASNALGWYQSDGCNPTLCPIIEVLNEPGGTWFWGSNAMSESNASAYDAILIATYNAFKNAYGSNRPILLASFDGGFSSGSNWGQYMWQANSSIGNYIDGITTHPYNQQSTDLGYQSNVTNSYSQAKSLAGRSIPMYITEIGWQTTQASDDNGDPPQSGVITMSTTQQCNNVFNYMSWARSLGYVKAVMLFDYRDDNSQDGTYGIEYGDGVQKPSYNALKAASANQSNTCPAS